MFRPLGFPEKTHQTKPRMNDEPRKKTEPIASHFSWIRRFPGLSIRERGPKSRAQAPSIMFFFWAVEGFCL